MEFTLEQEKAKEIGLNEEQISAINAEISSRGEILFKELNLKANENAEGILKGAAKAVYELTGIERQQGQKIADYISSAGVSYSQKKVESLKSEIEQKQKELDEKLKNGKVDETLKLELEQAKLQISKFDEVKSEIESGLSEKISSLSEKNNFLIQKIGIEGAKPKFPETVNKYEAEAKWKEFVANLHDKFDIVMDNDEKVIARDKQNEYKTFEISELVSKDEKIQELLKERKKTGIDIKAGDIKKIDGLPIEILTSDSKAEISEKIKEYLTKEENLDPLSKKFSEKLTEMYRKATT